MPEVPRRPDDQRVGAEFPGHRRELPGRVATAGADVHLKLSRIGEEVELGEEPALERLGIPGQADDLPGKWLTVNTRRRHINHEKRTFESARHSGGVGERVPRRGRSVVADHNWMDNADRPRWRRGPIVLALVGARPHTRSVLAGPPLFWLAFGVRLFHRALGGRTCTWFDYYSKFTRRSGGSYIPRGGSADKTGYSCPAGWRAAGGPDRIGPATEIARTCRHVSDTGHVRTPRSYRNTLVRKDRHASFWKICNAFPCLNRLVVAP